MTNEITITGLRDMKRTYEMKLAALLTEFEEASGTYIDEVDARAIDVTRMSDRNAHREFAVCLTLKLDL